MSNEGKPSIDTTSVTSSTAAPSTSSDSTSAAARPSADSAAQVAAFQQARDMLINSEDQIDLPPAQKATPATFFNRITKSYADVSREPGVDTTAFLEASEGVLALFDLLGSTAFGLVTKDMSGNIQKTRTRFLEAPIESATLEGLIAAEVKTGKKTATQGLLWLLRGLEFTCTALRRSQDDLTERLNVSFTKAYEVTLRKHHSMLVRPLFAVAMKACPERNDFYNKLGPIEIVTVELNAWLDGLQKIITQLQAFYTKGGYDKGL
ncbi:GLTP-domain-containing protein [Clavulina sp. PMI_390]|nr:GLTP-domain-containing protein [Clavulina sp. PMI_390]